MDQQQTRNINQAAEQLTDSMRQAFQIMADRTVALQESNLRLTQDFFQNWMQQIQSQTQGNREAAQTLQEQGQRQQEAVQGLTQEATNVYSNFLNSALSFYQETMRMAAQAAQGNIESAVQATQQGVSAADQAAQQSMRAASQAEQQGVEAATQITRERTRAGEQSAQEAARAAQRATAEMPIEGYDELNVREVTQRLDNLSAEELQRVRDHEIQNKNRETLLQQIDRRIGGTL